MSYIQRIRALLKRQTKRNEAYNRTVRYILNQQRKDKWLRGDVVAYCCRLLNGDWQEPVDACLCNGALIDILDIVCPFADDDADNANYLGPRRYDFSWKPDPMPEDSYETAVAAG